jgi:hypothetical protein
MVFMKSYKKIGIMLFMVAILLGISGYSIYVTFLKSEDVTFAINTKAIKTANSFFIIRSLPSIYTK